MLTLIEQRLLLHCIGVSDYFVGHYTDDDVSYLSSGVHPYPGQRVECIQALHRVQGASQPPEDPVSTGGHLQLPTQESHREQGELKVTTTYCVTDQLPLSGTLSSQQLL